MTIANLNSCLGVPLSREFEDAKFGDLRLTKRLKAIVDKAAQGPTESFPAQSGTDAALEGTYRFLNNTKINPDSILASHVEMTCKRAEALTRVLVAHDTTSFAFSGEKDRDGLGPLKGNGQQGFFAHAALAISADGRRHPLGVMGMHSFVRQKEPKGKRTVAQRRQDPDRESLRWEKLALQVGERLAGRAHVVHLMDREGDSYELFCGLKKHDQSFIIRLSHDRRTEGGTEPEFASLYEAISGAESVVERMVSISRRLPKNAPPKANRIHPPRDERVARLNFSATTVEIKRGKGLPKSFPASLVLNYVRVFEIDPPDGQDPIEWRLVTTEPISTVDDILAVVDGYRARWVIEEYFKALKTGCGFEKRQLESLPALLNALAILASVAWRLLLLRSVTRNFPEEPATTALTEIQIKVLCADPKLKLSKKPTVRQAMLAVAQLGGHIKNNGEPGWLVLGRGFDRVLDREAGWMACQETLFGM